MILRDGKYIGKTTRLYFEDRIPIGVHSYQVFQALADGYVDRSNIITIDIKTKCPVIAPLAGGDFIELQLSTEEDRAQDFQRSREVARMRYSGTRWPVSEAGEAETLSVSFDAAWKQTDKAEADAFGITSCAGAAFTPASAPRRAAHRTSACRKTDRSK